MYPNWPILRNVELPRWDGGFDAPIEALWRAFAQEVGGRFVPGDLWQPDRLELPAAPWSIRVWVEQFGAGQRGGSLAVTVWEATYEALAPFRIHLARHDAAEAPPLKRELALGGDTFARRFVLSAEPESFGAALIQERWLRDYLEAEGHIGLDADRHGLRCRVAGPVREPERLLWVTQVVLTALHACRDAGLIAGKPAPPPRDDR